MDNKDKNNQESQNNNNQNHFFRDRPNSEEKATEITIGTFNIQSVKGNRIYLKHLLQKLDICCVQEHWLFKPEQNLLQNI